MFLPGPRGLDASASPQCQQCRRDNDRPSGAAVVALTIDEVGMAKTRERKLEIARRIHDIATQEFGLVSSDLIFDALTFTLATGEAELRDVSLVNGRERREISTRAVAARRNPVGRRRRGESLGGHVGGAGR